MAPEYDFVYIALNSDNYPIPKVVQPDSPDDSRAADDIEGTATEDAVGIIQAEQYDVKHRGTTSCFGIGTINEFGSTYNPLGFDACADIQEAVKWGNWDDAEGGDSGALVYTQQIESQNNNRFAVNLHSGSGNTIRRDVPCFGAAGYAIRNDYNMWWE